MSNLRSESEVLDLEKGKGSDPKTDSTSSAAQNKDTELVTDPRKARLINFVLVFVLAVLCVAAIVVFVYSIYSMHNGTISFWKAFGYCAVFVVCVVSIGTVLMVRKALISKFAAARPVAAATTTAARPPPPAAARPRPAPAGAAGPRPAATTTAARPVATASAARRSRRDDIDPIDPLEALFLL